MLKFLGVVLLAGAVGAGLGIVLAELTGSDEEVPPLAPTTTATTATTTATTRGSSTTATTRRPTTSTTQRDPSTTTASAALRLVPRVQIQSAVLFPARTQRGRARRRARVVVRVRVTNREDTTVKAQIPTLVVGDARVVNDPSAASAAGTLLKAIGPRAGASGELRFETSGDVTQALTNARRARLRIAGRTVVVKLTISPTPVPG